MKSAELKKYLREQCEAYRMETADRCECYQIMKRCPEFQKWNFNHRYPGLVVHHLFGRSNAESQAFCNLILVSNACHEFFHQKGGLDYNVSHAAEAVCLYAKWKRHHSLEGKTFPIPDRADRVHWSIGQLDAIRAKCVSCKTIAVRVEVLADSLAGSLFEDVALKLVEAVK